MVATAVLRCDRRVAVRVVWLVAGIEDHHVRAVIDQYSTGACYDIEWQGQSSRKAHLVFRSAAAAKRTLARVEEDPHPFFQVKSFASSIKQVVPLHPELGYAAARAAPRPATSAAVAERMIKFSLGKRRG